MAVTRCRDCGEYADTLSPHRCKADPLEKAAEILEKEVMRLKGMADSPDHGHVAHYLRRESYLLKFIAKALRGEE